MPLFILSTGREGQYFSSYLLQGLLVFTGGVLCSGALSNKRQAFFISKQENLTDIMRSNCKSNSDHRERKKKEYSLALFFVPLYTPRKEWTNLVTLLITKKKS